MKKHINLPKIGIRPVIDGRRMGVRESLEEQTMNMAKATANLLTKHICHVCGTPVECVIADSCISGLAESAICDEKFSTLNVGLTITVTPCWCYGSETLDMDPARPKAIWGFNGTERPGAVYLAAALAAYAQKGIPAFSIYGHEVQDADDTRIPDDVKEKLLRFARAGLAVASMKGKTYLAVGGVSMGIAGSIVDHNFFESWLGMKVQSVDMTELRRRIDKQIYDEEELKLALSWADKYFQYGEDTNAEQYRRSPESRRQILRESLLMAICIRDMMQGNPKLKVKGYREEALGYNAIVAGFQGQRHWTDQYPNGDTAEAILNSSFDWNGIRQPFTIATENDSLNGVAMLFGHMLTGTAQIFADVRTFWSPESVERVTGQKLTGQAENGVIHLINSGSATLDGTCCQKDDQGHPTMKPHWEITDEEVNACLAATRWYPAIHEYFRGGGFSSKFLTKGGIPFTMSRINIIKTLGPVLQIAEGWSAELPKDIHDVLDKRTNETWPTTWFVPRLTGKGAFKDVYSVMANWGANHGVLSIGHVGADFITLAAMLRIPVCMHNVDEKAIYRPSSWRAHGMDPEGSDYRACQNYGPLYKQ
ncbi:L-fucose isomerase [Photorhabdus cinerea]|uniref:L-fucose isomerase n=1 Tax=Photorhabdus cinerea TaxID=471575 RepID=A0A7X5QF46_9GAMM|nr:L-fucose isomerase [Photorhabdus cinerea]NHB93072.1 L-fucose isomerase [Photorhabdus cinerea]